MTAHLLVPIAIVLLVWIGAGFRQGQLDWLERRTGLPDPPGNAMPDRDI